jgi:mitogen-activated protein kinase kinase kinase
MSMEKVKQTCVKVFGEDGQTRIVNVHTASESNKTIMAKILHKFGIDESSTDSYCIFVGSSTNGEARALSDQELVDICRSADRPEKERLILRKRHMYPTHEEFKRKGTINATRRQQYQQKDDSKPSSPLYNGGWSGQQSTTTLNRPDYLSYRSSQTGSFRSQNASNSSMRGGGSTSNGRRRFFGERPPSEVISSNLPSFFPNHNREVLETAGIKVQRLSMTRRNSALSRLDSRNYRNSVLPELVSVLGVDLDKFLEEEEEANDDEDDYSLISSSTVSDSTESDSEEEEAEEKVAAKVEMNDTSAPSTATTAVEEEEKNEEETSAVVVVSPAAEESSISPTKASAAPIATNNNEMTVPSSSSVNQKRSSSLFYLNEYKSFKPAIEDSMFLSFSKTS